MATEAYSGKGTPVWGPFSVSASFGASPIGRLGRTKTIRAFPLIELLIVLAITAIWAENRFEAVMLVGTDSQREVNLKNADKRMACAAQLDIHRAVARVSLSGVDENLQWAQEDDALVVDVPKGLLRKHAAAFRIDFSTSQPGQATKTSKVE